MVKLVNRCKVATSTAGTGTITLGAAEEGFQSFADAGVVDGDVVRYVIEDGAEWEIGEGTYTASGTTLSRTVLESSNADAAISLSGNAVVFASAVAEDIPAVWIETAVAATTSGTSFAVSNIPAGITELELILDSVSSNSNVSLSCRIGSGGSVDTTGYTATSSVVGGGFSVVNRNNAFVFFANAAVSSMSMTALFRKLPGTNTWVQSHAGTVGASSNASIFGGGVVTLGGELDTLDIIWDGGTALFDAGSFFVRYR